MLHRINVNTETKQHCTVVIQVGTAPSAGRDPPEPHSHTQSPCSETSVGGKQVSQANTNPHSGLLCVDLAGPD